MSAAVALEGGAVVPDATPAQDNCSFQIAFCDALFELVGWLPVRDAGDRVAAALRALCANVIKNTSR
jgi:hypothetical protein